MTVVLTTLPEALENSDMGEFRKNVFKFVHPMCTQVVRMFLFTSSTITNQ